jgi:pantoate--beta-alanine ligase
MKTFTTVESLRTELDELRNEGQSIAFVPTMGALHQGHISLIKTTLENASCSIASIFVNPTQFNNPEDLTKYPRTLKEDSEMLEKAGCKYLFAPSVEEIYPNGTSQKVQIDLKGMDEIMEGKFRPGHFEGMLQVVKRLLDIVDPNILIMGQKDYQQFSIVNQMIMQLNMPIKLIVAPTMRESDGLAMSSRNRRLTTDMRCNSTVLYKALQYAESNVQADNIAELEKTCKRLIEAQDLKPEYLEIVDATDLSQIRKYKDDRKIVACVAAWAGEVRLIDNLILN